MSEKKATIQFGIESLVPKSWFTKLEGSSIWVAGYKMYRVQNTSLPSGPQLLDFGTTRAVFIFGSGQYLDARAVDPQFTEDGEVVLRGFSKIETQLPEGAYLLIITPFDVDGKPGNELETRQRISEITGLLISFEGRNIAFHHIYDNVHELSKPERSVISPTLVNPFSLPVPDISQTRLQLIADTYKRIFGLPNSLNNRIRLSLRWFVAACYDSDLDAFLKYWIALEILAMPDTTDIQPINGLLSTAYGISMQEVGQTYHVGRIYGLRSRIVHDGFTPTISYKLLDFIAAIYSDVLSQIIGSPFDKRAQKFLTEQDNNILSIIPV